MAEDMKIFVVVLLTMCVLHRTNAKEIQCGYTMCDSSLEYCEKVLSDCQPCSHACKVSPTNCQTLCPEYYGSVISDIGFTMEIDREIAYLRPKSSDEEGSSKTTLISIVVPLSLIVIVFIVMSALCIVRRLFRLKPIRSELPSENDGMAAHFAPPPPAPSDPPSHDNWGLHTAVHATFGEHNDAFQVEHIQPITDQHDNYTYEPSQVLQVSHVVSSNPPSGIFASATHDNTVQIPEETPVKQPCENMKHHETPLKHVDSEKIKSWRKYMYPIGHETPVKQPLGSEDTNHETSVKKCHYDAGDEREETPLKQPHNQEDIPYETPVKQPISSEGTETPLKQHQSVQNTNPLVQEAVPRTYQNIHTQQPQNSTSPGLVNYADRYETVVYIARSPITCSMEQGNTSSDEEPTLSCNNGTPASNDIGDKSQPMASNEESPMSPNHGNSANSDSKQFIEHDHGTNHHSESSNTTSVTEQSELSLHEDPAGIRGMQGILHLRNPPNTPAHNQYVNESISLDNGSYSGPSFSMPSSAGFQRSLSEEDEEYIQAQQRTAREAPPLNSPDDIESKLLQTRVLT